MKPPSLIATASATLILFPLVNIATAGTQVAEHAAASTGGGDNSAELAKKLANPLAAMISIPFQNNFDWGGGPSGDGFQYKLNFQPVIPFDLSEDWNLISRTIMPFVSQNNIVGTTFNWEEDQWTVPINLSVKQLTKLGKTPVKFELGARYYAEAPDNGPEWGMRFSVTFLLPQLKSW